MKKEFNLFIKILFTLIKTILKLVKQIIKIVYITIKIINNLFAKGFNKLPRLFKVSIVYSLIGLSLLNFIELPINNNKIIKETLNVKTSFIDSTILENAIVNTEEIKIETIVENKNACTLDNEIACKIYEKAIDNGLTREQSLIVVSISAHETGYWSSSVFKNKNNFGGVMCSTGLKNYETLEDGLNGFVDLLTNRYFGKGLDTIEKIGNVYCPVGASNDPTGVNVHWIPSVTSIYNNYLQK